MPSKTPKQKKFMAAVANSPKFAKKVGVPQSVGKEFAAADKAKEDAEELPAGHYDTHVRLQRGGRWNAHTVNVRKTDKELIQKFLDQGFRIVKPFDEDNEEIEYENPATRRKEAQRAANERARKRWEDPEYWKKFGVKGLGLDTPKEDNEGGALQPRVGISGIKHEDAMAKAALSKDYKHKPYVSSYVGGESDGFRKIFAVLGSDGKVVHKTRDKQEAHQWLKDNYENI